MFGAALNQDLPSGGTHPETTRHGGGGGSHRNGGGGGGAEDEDEENAFINLMEHRGEMSDSQQSNGQAGRRQYQALQSADHME